MISNAPKDEGKRPDNEGAHSDGTRDDRPDATRNPSKSNVALVSQTTGTANLAEWAKLDLKDQTAGVLRVSRIRHDHLFGILAEEVTLPFARFPRLADSDAILDIAEIARRHGLSLGRSTERVSFVSAPRDVARLLGIALGTGVLKPDRITQTIAGEPVEWRVAYVWKQRGASGRDP